MKEIAGFEIISKLGQGGMGTVFKARQASLDRIVALKILPPSAAKDAMFIERFQREARASAKLNHPNIVQGIDVGRDSATGLWYFAMEYVEGPSLRKILDEQKSLPETRALEIVKDVARALEVVDAHRIVHRDIKPDNILVAPDGTVKLADLGLAKQLNEDVSLTQSGQAVGTPHYMPPELARGQNSACDIRTDIYSLGATLFHLVTGKPPFSGETAAVVMVKHMTEAPPKAGKLNPAVSDGCTRLIDRMLQKKPEQRVQSPAELIVQIDRILKGEAPAPRAAAKTAHPRAANLERKHSTVTRKSSPVLLYGIVAAGLLVAAGAAFVFGGRKPQPVSAETPRTAPKPTPTGETPPTPKPALVATPSPAPQPVSPPTPLPASGTGVKNAAGKEPARIADEEQARLKAEWIQVMERVADAEKANDYDTAIHILHSLPARLNAHRETATLRAEALKNEAGELIAELLRKSAALTSTDPVEALALVEQAERFRYAPMREKVAAQRQKLEGAVPAAAGSAPQNADPFATELWSTTLQKFDAALLETGDLKLAGEIAEVARKDTGLKPFEKEVSALGAILSAYEDAARFELDELAKLSGRTVELETAGGKLKGAIGRVQDGVLTLNIDIGGGNAAAKKVKVTDILEPQRRKLTPPFVPSTPAQRVALSYTRLSQPHRDAPGALELLKDADGFPLTEHCRTLAAAVKAGREKAQAEGAAPTAWSALQARASAAKITEADARALLDRFAQFDAEFGSTDFAKAQADAIEAARTRVWRVLHPNIVVNGDFEKGSWEGWQRSGGSLNSEISTETPHAGKHAMYINIQRDYNATLSQLLTVEPQAEYRLSCWIKYIKGSLEQGRGGLFIIEGGEGERKFDERSWLPLLPKVKAGEWVKVEMTYVPQSPTIRLDFFLRQTSIATERYYLLIDDIEFARVSK